jgi:hypothetical protein
MVRYVLASLAAGILFMTLDALIHANPLAQRLYEVYRPLVRTSINVSAGVAIDLLYGFTMAAFFLLLYEKLPGGTGLSKGVCFAIMVWFFRVFMGTAGEWVTYNVPVATHLYSLLAGFGEMLILGVTYGAILRPST